MQGVTGPPLDLAGAGVLPDDRVAVAVSGGADSLALLLLAHAAIGERLIVLTVDHGLREGSAAEAAMVACVSAGLGVAHSTLSWAGDKPAANLQAAARTARYALMDAWCVDADVPWLLTAHHADDQAETLLMRLARGSGLGGLAGIRARRTLAGGTVLLRPLLGVRRAALRAVVDAAGLTPVDDPANRDPRHDRTRVRQLLAGVPDLDALRFAASAAHLAAAAAALDWAEALAWDSRAEAGPAGLVVDAAGLPAELRHRLAARALMELGVAADGPAVARMVARLEAGAAATLGGVQVRGHGRWVFRPVPPRVRR